MEQTQSAVINSVIGEGTFYNGTIEAVDILRIDGSFTGTARSRDVILVGIYGKIKGTLSSSRIIITGMVDGIVQNTDLVVLQSSCVVMGTIEAKNIIIESHAVVSATLKSLCIQYVEPSDRSSKSSIGQKSPVRIIERFSPKTLERMFSE